MLRTSSSSSEEWNTNPLVRGSFLPGDAWQNTLGAAFNASILRLEMDGIPFGAVTCFRAGPLSIGYMNFPSGLPLTPICSPLPSPFQMRDAVASAGLDILRFKLPFDDPRFQTKRTNRTFIDNLKQWSASERTKSRRSNNKLRRGNICIQPANSKDTTAIHELYTATVRRHDGQLRYPLAYFRELINLSRIDQRNRIRVARPTDAEDGPLVGFNAFTVGETSGTYLHGGHNPAYRSLYAADQLFLTMIQETRRAGANLLDLLASPQDQPSLRHYKESWGGRTQMLFQYSVGQSAHREWALRAAEWIDHHLGGRISGRG